MAFFHSPCSNTDSSNNRFENTYPGVRCDIPAHAYQSGFSPNTQWTEEFAQGAEIRKYWQGVARKHNVYQYLRLQQRVQKTEWLADEGKWKVTIEHVDGTKKVSLSLAFGVSWMLSLTQHPRSTKKSWMLSSTRLVISMHGNYLTTKVSRTTKELSSIPPIGITPSI